MSFMDSNAQLSESLEDYLEVILRYGEAGSGIRLTDIASNMNVSKPSAHQAVQRLKELGYVNAVRYDAIHLTKEGREAALRVSKRHSALVAFLSDILGVGAETAEKDACRIEHVISRETMDRINQYVDKFSGR
jgi:DtxR family Mn-dependent transcriptional regulator